MKCPGHAIPNSNLMGALFLALSGLAPIIGQWNDARSGKRCSEGSSFEILRVL